MITFNDGSYIKYTYDAAGRKLRTEHRVMTTSVFDPGTGGVVPDTTGIAMPDPENPIIITTSMLPTASGGTGLIGDDGITDGTLPLGEDGGGLLPYEQTTIDYCGNIIYENGKLSRILFDGGFITFPDTVVQDALSPTVTHTIANTSRPEYHYFFCDHLGSVRVVTDAQGNIEQINHYYPYGVLMGESKDFTLNQPYKYNGKELDRKNGLDTYDYGARHYRGHGTWGQPDPHTENYCDASPFSYCHNNPINKIDPNGMDDYYTGTGDFIRHEDNETDRIMIRQWQIGFNILDTQYTVSLFRPIQDCDNISAEMYSNVFTQIISTMDEVDKNDLHNGKVSVRIFEQNGNLPYSVDNNNDADFSITLPYASIQENRENHKQLLTAYIDNKPTRKDIFSTVSNIKNLLGVHEYIGHYKLGLRHDNGGVDLLLNLQHTHSTWETTTPIFKSIFK